MKEHIDFTLMICCIVMAGVIFYLYDSLSLTIKGYEEAIDYRDSIYIEEIDSLRDILIDHHVSTYHYKQFHDSIGCENCK